MIITKCDKCKKIIEKEETDDTEANKPPRVYLFKGSRLFINGVILDDKEHDICTDCYEKLWHIIDKFMKENKND